MLANMGIRACALFKPGALLACLAFALPAAAETVYKYRNADGTMTYSNRLLRNAELVETFEYNFPRAARPAPSSRPSNAEAAADERMKRHLASLDKVWNEVQQATRALAAAEARLAAGDAPLAGEATGLASPPATVPPAVGGSAPAVPPAAGGPMGTTRGGGRNAEYFQRQAALEADVARARTRLDRALSDYNQLR